MIQEKGDLQSKLKSYPQNKIRIDKLTILISNGRRRFRRLTAKLENKPSIHTPVKNKLGLKDISMGTTTGDEDNSETESDSGNTDNVKNKAHTIVDLTGNASPKNSNMEPNKTTKGDDTSEDSDPEAVFAAVTLGDPSLTNDLGAKLGLQEKG